MLDHRKLLAEIEDEVRRRRDEDDALPDLERELDVVFARYAPVHAVDGDFERVLTRAAELTFVDPLAPTESRLPAITFTKRVIRKLSLWMLRHLSVQTTGFAETITRAVRLLGKRLDVLELALPVATLPDRERTAVPDEEHWAAFLAKQLADVDGRVLHVEAGVGSLVAALVDAGVDVYGVDPTPAPVLEEESRAPARDSSSRTGVSAADHLAVVADHELAAVILSGWVDRLPLPGKTALLDAALAKVRPGGRVVVVGTDPRAWAASVGTVHADLAAGRPLHAETWRRLLDERGCTTIDVHAAPRVGGLEPVPDATPALAANLERVDELLFPPRSYAVTAVV